MNSSTTDSVTSGIDDLLVRMDTIGERLATVGDARRYFHATYTRTTRAVRDEILAGGFEDGPWVALWDVAFAGRYLDSLEAWERTGEAPGPWQVAFATATQEPADGARTIPPLEHVLLGMNAHINFDLAPALLDVITPAEFADSVLLAKRGRDHGHIDSVLAGRVAAEDVELRAVEAPGTRTLVDRVLQPFNRLGTKRFLRESRRKVWHNAHALDAARRDGAASYAALLATLEECARAKVADLRGSRWVILELARRGFGVQLPQR